MKNFEKEFKKTRELIETAQKIVIISHRGPDGDAVGANLGLRLALRHQLNKQVASACVDPPPANCDFLPEVGEFVRDFDQAAVDLLIFVDCGARYMSKFHETKPELFSGKPPVINIDHHASNDHFGQVNIVDEDAAAASELIYYFLAFCGLEITRQIATCLLNGLYFDTGSFMHSNTSPAILEVASNLLWKGADFKTIAKRQFHTMPVKQLKVYGKILENARVNSKKMTISALRKADLESMNAGPDETTGAIDYLNSIVDGNFCCFLYEDRKGLLKGSLRTRADDIDLSNLAGLFGGGGHKKAAGFTVPGRLLETDGRFKIEGV
ncbi:DHH family phosphoesterase [Candidatus Peregrinibacteria bacterium]|nr:DHH family phosphoesterase [Candidatus Peregrinibacteria bacterium]